VELDTRRVVEWPCPPGGGALPFATGTQAMIERHLRLCGIAFAGTLMATPAMSQAPAPAVSEGQIVKYIETVNHGEIADAKMALRRSKDADIKNFAKEMIKDHGASDKKMTELARHLKLKPASSEETTSLMSEAKSGDKELRAAKGTDFDKAYIDVQAKMHGEVADTIQNQFVPAATSDEMKSALSDTRSTVQNHQKMAQDLANKMQ
jgi:putative membrane protein